MKLTLTFLALAVCLASGCTVTDTTAPTEDVQSIPKTGVGTFGGPGAFGGGERPALPTSPTPGS